MLVQAVLAIEHFKPLKTCRLETGKQGHQFHYKIRGEPVSLRGNPLMQNFEGHPVSWEKPAGAENR